MIASCLCFAQSGTCNSTTIKVLQAPINITQNGVATVVINNNAIQNNIHVCKINFAASPAVDITLVSIAPGGSYVALGGPMQDLGTYSFDWDGQLVVGAGQSFGLLLDKTAVVGGQVTFYYGN